MDTSEDVITFDATRLIQGIEFHLYNGHPPHIASEVRKTFNVTFEQVTPDSLLALRDQLQRKGFVLKVPRSLWRDFKDMDRLAFLTGAINARLVALDGSEAVAELKGTYERRN